MKAQRKSVYKEIACVVFGALLLVLGSPVEAQQAKKVPRIGYVSVTGDPSIPGPQVEAFRQGLRDLGYVEGKNILIEYRYYEGKPDRIRSLVAELVQLKVDVLVLGSLQTIRAAKQATKTIPIVIVTVDDPVATGLVDSLAHPGGNITGLTRLTRGLSAKRLELLKEVVPAISRVEVFWGGTNAPGSTLGFKEYETAARTMKLQLQSLEVRGPNPDVEGAFRAATKGSVNALILIRNPVINRNTKRIADLAIKHRTPSMCERSEYVDAGCLISYTSNDSEYFRRAATYVDKILKGAKPAELPVEQPTKFELIINLKTAKQIGLTIPQTVLYRADKMIK